MVLNLVLLLVWIICIAFLWNEGMWSNMLSFLNTLLAALIATNWYEPLANFLEGRESSFTYFWDFLALWILFALSLALLRAITDSISKTRVRFKMPVEHTGRVLLSILTGWVFVCFVTTTLHTAPLARESFRGSFGVSPQARPFFGLAPDLTWLGFVQNASLTGYSQPDAQATGVESSDQGMRVFDPQGEFTIKYAARRHALAQEEKMRVRK
ncbi:MAG: CvpA family protein [Pirellulales bacterium]